MCAHACSGATVHTCSLNKTEFHTRIVRVQESIPMIHHNHALSKKWNPVAMTTHVVQQLVNNSGLTLSRLMFVFLPLRLCERAGFKTFPNKVTLSSTIWRLFLSVTVFLVLLQLSSYLPAVLVLQNDLFVKFYDGRRLSEKKLYIYRLVTKPQIYSSEIHSPEL